MAFVCLPASPPQICDDAVHLNVHRRMDLMTRITATVTPAECELRELVHDLLNWSLQEVLPISNPLVLKDTHLQSGSLEGLGVKRVFSLDTNDRFVPQLHQAALDQYRLTRRHI